jgi:hypothetical protein
MIMLSECALAVDMRTRWPARASLAKEAQLGQDSDDGFLAAVRYNRELYRSIHDEEDRIGRIALRVDGFGWQVGELGFSSIELG